LQEVFQHFTLETPVLRLVSFIGGTDVDEMETDFIQHGGHIIVGTPGRIESALIKVRHLDIRQLEVNVTKIEI
jgi:superfamily II DNA/RNA helicase